MNIVLLIGADLWTGSGVTYSRLARRFTAHGHDVTIVAHDQPMAAQFREQGARAVPRWRWFPAHSLRRAFRAARPDVVIADMKLDVLQAVEARGTGNFPILYRYNVLNGVLQARPDDRRTFLSIDGIIFQSRNLEQRVRAGVPWLAPIPGHVIYAGYELEEFAVDPAQPRELVRRRLGVPHDALLVVSNSEVNDTKGSDLVVRAVAQVAARSSQAVRLVLLGRSQPGWLDPVLASAPIEVQLTGNIGRAEVLATCAAADVVMHPSREEIWPNAVVEAMGVGAPVVVSDAGGLPELVGPSGAAGIVVPRDQLSPLARALEVLLADPVMRQQVGQAARARIATEFPLRRMLARYGEVFASVGAGSM